MALVIAGIIAILSVVLGLLGLAATLNSDAPRQTSGVKFYVIGGLILAALIAATHWMPHVSW